MTGPFAVRRREGILFLELDTPSSPINILTPEARAQIEETLAEISPSRTRAVVFASKKPNSFINGARLLDAASLRTGEAAKTAALDIRRTYDAISRCPVPTVAAVSGSCFGCGMELTLWCDHRAASDSYDTQFYMTEVADYLLTPIFGATQKLPPLVGFDAACAIILWGRRVRAGEAKKIGLVDRVLRHDHFEADLDAFLASLPRKKKKKTRRSKRAPSNAAIIREQQRIEELPREVRSVYRSALSLCRLPFDARIDDARAFALELEAFSSSVTSKVCSQAVSFFFVRQTAEQVSAGRLAPRLPSLLSIHVDRGLGAWAKLLHARPLAGVALDGKDPTLVFHGNRKRPNELAVNDDTTVYFPFGFEHAACEVSGNAPPPEHLVDLLRLLGFTPVVTRARGRMASDRMIAAKKSVASMIAEGLRCLDDGVLAHRAQVDLLAHLCCGYPIWRGSLFKLIEEVQVETAVARALGDDEPGARALLKTRGFVSAARNGAASTP